VPAGATAIAPTVFADIGHTVGDRSRAACVTRAQHIVKHSAAGSSEAGWHESFDHGRAARFVENMRTSDDDNGADPRFQQEVIAWAHDHGQSLDWLWDGDLVGMICRRASHSPVATAIPDPAFAAVEHCQATWKALGEACEGEPDEKRSPLHAAWDAKQETVNLAHSDAEWDMVQTAIRDRGEETPRRA
jgi:hypothetical protein